MLAEAELGGREAESTVWDVIVVGTGMGGGMLGYSLARSGRRVLFIDKGRATLAETPGVIRGGVPELVEPESARSTAAYLSALARGGRSTDEVIDISSRFPKKFVPFIGSGTGGSSALYGMVCERFFAEDFTPRQNFHAPGESTVPDAWPISFEQMQPWYAAAELLLGVRGAQDPLRADKSGTALPPAPPFSPENQSIVDYLRGRGLHPYHLPMACDYTESCATCQTYLCDRSCKNDAARNAVLPAVTEHGARLLAECRALRLEADSRHVTRVICQRRTDMLALTGRIVVLAAGALATPLLLLNSRSGQWPRGLANGSGWVGRNLMRHLLDPVEVWLHPGQSSTAANKEIGLNDFYLWEGQKYGTIQSFGAIPPMEWLTNRPGTQGKLLRSMTPAVRQIYQRFVTGGLIIAAMMEDLPYLDNRVLPYDQPSLDGRQRMRIQYRLHPNEIERRAAFLRHFNDIFAPFRRLPLGSGKDNANLGHVCGTCRFGTDPATSVLDSWNRAHEVENLYAVDTSFFPSSAGLNPSLTVAANALRVAEHINQAHFPD